MAEITTTNPLIERVKALEEDNETYGELLTELADFVANLQYIIKIAFTLGGQYHEPFPGEQGMAMAQKKLRKLMAGLPSLADAIDDERD